MTEFGPLPADGVWRLVLHPHHDALAGSVRVDSFNEATVAEALVRRLRLGGWLPRFSHVGPRTWGTPAVEELERFERAWQRVVGVRRTTHQGYLDTVAWELSVLGLLSPLASQEERAAEVAVELCLRDVARTPLDDLVKLERWAG